MNAIHRLEITNPEETFKAPKIVTFGWQEQRKAFSVWFSASDKAETDYRIVGTGHEFIAGGILRASVVMPDGFHVFHLVEITWL